MQVAVRFHGSAPGGERRLAFELSEDATAGELIERLAREGLPLAKLAADSEPRLPRELRVFSGGALVARRDERLARSGETREVTVVLLSPIAGG